jgi:signal transduction histidine kinase
MAGLLLLVLLVLLGIAAWIGREAAIQFALSRLHHDAEAIITSIDIDTRQITAPVTPIYRQPLSGHYYLVRFEDGSELRSRSLWDEPFQIPDAVPGRPRFWLTPGPGEQRLLIWQQHIEKGGKGFFIAIAEDVAPLLTAIGRFLWIGVIASLVLVLLLLLAQRWLIRRAFSRLDPIREDLRAIRNGDRDQISSNVPAEVRPVVKEFNQLLQTWKQHHERAHNAVGNLAHALKTPLQLILSESRKQKAPAIEAQGKRMQSLIERELKRARITGRSMAGRHFSPKTDLEALMETMAVLHQHKGLQFTTSIDAPDRLPLDQNDLMELAGNLLDNAAKWAQTRVRTQLKTSGNRVTLVIEDDGPGIDANQRPGLLERGNRLDENRPGHGLGLAIVNDIVTLYQGEIELDTSPELAGLRVVVTLPLNG